MKTRISVLVVISMLLYCCSLLTTEPPATNLGEVNLSINLGGVGSLSKTSAINLENLYIELNSGTTSVKDTVAISGNSQIIVNNSYSELEPGAWSVNAETRDVNDIVVHSDSTTFIVVAGNTVDVSLALTSKYSMLIANFVGIEDSVSRCELFVDAVMVADSSFVAQSAVGSTLSLSYDYLSTGADHNIKLDAYGDMWGTEYLLYTGDTTVTVVAGVNNSYTVNLLWVGPNEGPSGVAAVEITIGPTGTLTVNGNFPSSGNTVTDIDGNVYNTVIIGTQEWMAENLKVTHYSNGDLIPNVTDAAEWSNLTTGAYCEYDNNSTNVDTYGRLYNWYAVNDSRNIAPEGWHVPTDEDIIELKTYLGNDGGIKLKSISGWDNNGNGTDDYGFTALPNGYRTDDSMLPRYQGMGQIVCFWSGSQYQSNMAWAFSLHYLITQINDGGDTWGHGFSVRLLRD